MKRMWVSLVAAALITIAAVAPAAGQNIFSVPLDEVDDSGISGGASISGVNGEVEITVLVTEGLEDDAVHPVHIHEGTCDDLGDVAYPLEDIEDGSSETTLDVALEDLMTGEYAINAHLSEDEMETNIMCGNIPEMEEAAADEEDDAVVDEEDDAAVDDEDDAIVDEEDDATVDEEDDAVVDEEDDAVVDEEDDAVVDEEDDAVVDEEDDAVVEDDDAVETDDVAVVDDDEADDEDLTGVGGPAAADDEDVDEVAPVTGSIGGLGDEIAILAMTLLAGTALGAGLLVRRRAQQA